MRQSILFMLACVFLVATLSMCETTPATREDPEPDDCTLETDELDFESTFVGERRYMSVNMEFENISVFPEGETITIGCEDFAFWDPVLEQASDTYTYAWVQGYDVDVQILFEPLSAGEKTCEVDMGSDCGILTLIGTATETCILEADILQFDDTDIGMQQVLPITATFYSYYSFPDGETITIDCEDFAFWDPVLEQASDTYTYAWAGSYDVDVQILFEPLSTGERTCEVDMGSDCGMLELRGAGVNPPNNWVWFEQITVEDLHDVYGDADQAYACGDNGVVLRHTHGTPNVYVWMNQGFGGIPLDALWVDESGVVWVGGGTVDGGYTYAKAYFNTDGSTTWTDFGQSWLCDMVTSIWGTSSCAIYFGGPAISGMMQTIFYWDCASLASDYLGLGYEKVTGIHGSGPEDIWAVLDYYMYNAYHYDGLGWTLTRETWMDQALQDVWVAPDGKAWAVGAAGAIYHWTGIAWTDQSISGETRTIYGIWGLADNDIYAVGETGLIYHYNGNTWSELAGPAGLTETLYAVWGKAAPTLIYMVGTNGTVIGYTP
jgi:hypothetical protein